MLEALLAVLALVLFALLLIPIVVVVWKRRWWAAAAGLVVPFYFFDSLSRYSEVCDDDAGTDACDRADPISYLAFVVVLGVVVWVPAVVVARHRTRYPKGSGRSWIATGAAAAAIGVGLVAATAVFRVPSLERFGRAAPLIAAAVAAVSVGLLKDTRDPYRHPGPVAGTTGLSVQGCAGCSLRACLRTSSSDSWSPV